MRYLIGFVLLLLALGVLRTVGCGGDPCGGCDDGNPCTRDVCDSYNTSGTISCDPDDYNYRCVYPSMPDGTSCGGRNVCVSGVCKENPCAECEDDGNACTVDEGCDYVDGTCRYTPVDCGEDTLCSAAGCDPAVGCTYTPINEGVTCYGPSPDSRVGMLGTCQHGLCVGPCDPRSTVVIECEIAASQPVVCCPGFEYCPTARGCELLHE
jgi:hypothetical protein